MIVQHNLLAMNANRNLGVIAGAQSKSTEKLSSGYRINRAADDAAGLSISEKMRGQIRGLNQASTNAQDGISLIQTAEGALNETHAILQRMRELSVQAANGTETNDDREAVQAEIEQLKEEVTRISDTTEFNTMKLLDGSLGTTGGKNGVKVSLSVGENVATGAVTKTDAVKGVFTTTASTNVDSNAAVGDVISFTVDYKDANGNDKTTTVDLEYDKLTKLTDAYGNESAATSGAATVAEKSAAILKALKASELGNIFDITESSGAFTFTAKEAGVNYSIVSASEVWINSGKADNAQITVTETTEPVDAYNSVTASIGIYDGTGNIEDKVFTVNGQKFAYVNDATSLGDDNKDVNYVVASSIDATAAKAMAALINAKTGISAEPNSSAATTIDLKASTGKAGGGNMTLQIGANEGQTMSFGIGDMSSAALGIESINISTQGSAKTAMTTIDNAIKMVSEQRGKLGAVQNRLEHTIANLDTAAENTQAAESRIRDVDMADEMVTYSKNNILQQAAQSMLAQANQSTQGVLSLLQ